ncbi:RDD family protein [Jiella marina]|uniref:RDD family protein n=1 Tax=Jiella sp. LLJ827 TaxID=2917712 RepID=UPI002101B631|nr:RDD family protein [Jiella sp. LLJ827]MCQ0987088.1 RDD family protein [Jiella sp. LLJ827]
MAALRLRRKAQATAGRPQRVKDRRKRLTLTPPEGVPLHLDIASLGARFGAQFVDLVITTIGLVLVLLAFVYAGFASPDALGAISAFLLLLIGAPYYIITELLMNGRTFGKRMLGLRVVSKDGSGLSTHQIVVRNLTKEVEVFVPVSFLMTGQGASPWFVVAMLAWLVFVFAVPIRNKANQRIGDLIADTAVVLTPKPLLLADVAGQADATARERFVFSSAQLDLYGAYELQVLERLLRGGEASRPGPERYAGLAKIGQSIRAKIGYEETVSPAEEEAFLQSFYVAQRSYLEQKKLMGEARADKFHREDDTPRIDAASHTTASAPTQEKGTRP